MSMGLFRRRGEANVEFEIRIAERQGQPCAVDLIGGRTGPPLHHNFIVVSRSFAVRPMLYADTFCGSAGSYILA